MPIVSSRIFSEIRSGLELVSSVLGSVLFLSFTSGLWYSFGTLGLWRQDRQYSLLGATIVEQPELAHTFLLSFVRLVDGERSRPADSWTVSLLCRRLIRQAGQNSLFGTMNAEQLSPAHSFFACSPSVVSSPISESICTDSPEARKSGPSVFATFICGQECLSGSW